MVVNREHHRRHGKGRGFTFVETLIVIALFSIVGIALFGSFSAGLRVWKAASSPDFSHRKAVLGVERFSQDMRRSVHYRPLGFMGDQAGCSFVHIRDGKFYQVVYAFYGGEGAVMRSAALLGRPDEIMNATTPRVVMNKVKAFELGYVAHSEPPAGGEVFLPVWNSTAMGNIPRAVKIFVELEDGVTYERVVVLPTYIY